MVRRVREIWDSLRLVANESAGSFFRNDDLQKSATLAFYGFLALIPLFLLLVIVMSHLVFASDRAVEQVSAIISQMFPLSNDMIWGEVMSLASQRLWGWVTSIVLLWSVMPLASSIRSTLRTLFRTEQPLLFVKAKLLDLLAVLVIVMLFVGYVVAQILYSATVRGVLAGIWPTFDAVHTVLPFAGTILFLLVFYALFVPGRVGFPSLLAGAVIGALLLGGMNPVFRLILKYNPDYGFTLGSLKAVFLLSIWVYYSFAVILFGAEVIAALRRRETVVVRELFLRPATPHRYRHLLGRFVRTGDAGEVLFREGEQGNEMFYVLEGSVAISRGGTAHRTMQRGEFLGEMAMLLDAPRTATATIAEPGTMLAVISRENLEIVMRENPQIVMKLLREMADRLKTTTASIPTAP